MDYYGSYKSYSSVSESMSSYHSSYSQSKSMSEPTSVSWGGGSHNSYSQEHSRSGSESVSWANSHHSGSYYPSHQLGDMETIGWDVSEAAAIAGATALEAEAKAAKGEGR